MLIVENLSYSIEDKVILKNVNLSLKEGKCYLLVGRNGSGKTTILKIMADLLKPTRGEVIRFGLVGYVFQNPITQVIGSTVEEDVAFGLENMAIDRETMRRKVEEILRYVELLDLKDRDPLTLSGGQIQRLAIASILVLEPDVILLDEPISMLDHDGKREVASLLRKMKDHGKTLVIATHDFEEFDFCDEVIHISDGSISLKSVSEFFADPPDMIPKPSWIG